MKHKHYDMIVAKAANTELVVFLSANGGPWREYECGGFPAFSNGDYFLCLPKHKEACLHAINGGQSQATNETGKGEFQDVYTGKPDVYWTCGGWYMCDKCESRIKPKKEKRWIAISMSRGVCCELFESESKAMEAYPLADQFIEIEVEV